MRNLAACLAPGPRGELRARPLRAEEAYGTLAKANIDYLALVTKMKRSMNFRGKPDDPGFLFYSPEEIVLFKGSDLCANIHDMTLEHATIGECFINAFNVAMGDARWRYTEGWAMMEQSIPTHHAWLTGPNGEVEDPTWRSLIAENPERPGRCVYRGLAFEQREISAWALGRGYPNVLSFGEMTEPDVLRRGPHAIMEDLLHEEA